MREKDPAPEGPIYPDAPDEIIPVEDYGANIEVRIWHSPAPKIRTIFKGHVGTIPDESSSDKPWMRQGQLDILQQKAYLAGLGAISLRMSGLTDPQQRDLEPEIEDTPEVHKQWNLSELSQEGFDALRPGEIIHVDDIPKLSRLEHLVEANSQPNGVWGHNERWSLRTPLNDLVKPKLLEGKKFHGQVTDITLEVMDDPSQQLTDAWGSQQEKLFISSEKLHHNISKSLMAAVQESTIGFNITAQIKSTAGIYGTATSQVWYTAINLSTTDDIRRSMTRPQIIDVSKTNLKPKPNTVEASIKTHGGLSSRVVSPWPRRRSHI